MTYVRNLSASLRAIPVYIVSILLVACQSAGDRSGQANRVNPADGQGYAHQPPIRQQPLSAGVATAFFWDSTSTVTVAADTLLRIDGFLTLEIDQPYQPSKLRTSLMALHILEYPLLARIDAFDTQAGQSIEVFSGALSVRKAYESPWDDIDTLRAGDLYMINRDIDLSEKERLDDTTFGRWWADHRAGRGQ